MTLSSSTALAASAILVTVLVSGAAGARALQPAFAPSGLIAAGTNPCSFAVARLDGDENPDVAVTNCRSDSVAILLGDGGGHFRRAAGSPVAAGDGPNSIFSADFNGDGKADLAVANGNPSGITILLGNGSGGFVSAAGSPVSVVGRPNDVSAADFNDDGKVDLAVAAEHWISILLGDGSGHFGVGPGSPRPAGGRSGPDDVTVADFDQNGNPDLAVSTVDPMQITVLLGEGNGSVRNATTIRAGLKAVGDFNGDGKPDLAAVTQGSALGRYRATVLRGTGSGRFAAAPGLRMEGQFWSTKAVGVDLNGDHKLDLAFHNYGSTMSVLLGDGSGRLHLASDSSLPLPAWSSASGEIAAEDLNRDGQADLVLPIHRSFLRGGEGGLAILWPTPSGPTIVPGGSFPARGDPVLSTRTRISGLSADGKRAALVTNRTNRCGSFHIAVWTPPRRMSRTFNSECGDGVSQVALGAGQVAWIDRGGGNSLELKLTAASLPGGKPRRIEWAINGDRAGGDPKGDWVGQLLGGGPLLAYNRWSIVCEVPQGQGCDESTPTLRLTKHQLVRVVAGRRVVIKRGPASYPMAALGGGRIAIESAGALDIVAPNGQQVAQVPAVNDNPPRAVALTRTHLAVLRTFTLDLSEPTTGRVTKSIPLGRAASLQLGGVNSTLALLQSSRRLVLVRLNDGKLISLFLRSKSDVDASLTTAGLFYAYNLPRGRAKGRIVFEPVAKLLARF